MSGNFTFFCGKIADGEPDLSLLQKIVVVGTGFEPVKAKPADLQSAPVDRLGILPPGKSGFKAA